MPDRLENMGPYRLLRRLAVGGMAEVFLARDRNTPNQMAVALKCLHPRYNDTPRILRQFYREARLGMRFEHPALIPVWDVRAFAGRHVMVMPYVESVTLRAVLDHVGARNERLQPEVALYVVRHVADALRWVRRLRGEHRELLEIVHCDVSPDNILIDPRGYVYLIDFGIAVRNGEPASAGLAGRVAYMSPEQCRQDSLDGRSDIYALGTVFWELLRGRAPYPRHHRIRALREITGGRLAPPMVASTDERAPTLNTLWAMMHAKSPVDRVEDVASLVGWIDMRYAPYPAACREMLGACAREILRARASDGCVR